jgi:predicted nucleotidyltransferase component of viral defense system
MIPRIFIEQWQQNVPWQTIAMIEHDLIISKALVCLYNDPKIKDSLVFRGGTALNKLFIHPPARYSEDLDFVQRKPESIGETMSAIRKVLDPWLGEPKRKITERGVKLIYKYISANELSAKLKIEINTTEHFQVHNLHQIPYSVSSEWFSGSCVIETYQLEELMATKLRALYQRRKGRDLFDIWWVSIKNLIDVTMMISIFQKYCINDKRIISKDLFLENLELKRSNQDFKNDMNALLPTNVAWDFENAFEYVLNNIISQIPSAAISKTNKSQVELEEYVL